MKGRAIVIGLIFLLVLFSGCLQDPILIRLSGGANPSDFNGDILGKPNQVTVTNGANRLFGSADVNIILPQDINTISNVTFNSGVFGSGTDTVSINTPSVRDIRFGAGGGALITTESPSLGFRNLFGSGTRSLSIVQGFTEFIPAVGEIPLGRSTIRWGTLYSTGLDNTGPSYLTDVNANDINTTTLCLSSDCRTVWPTGSGGTGRTYTSGTPATIQVDNDLNTISQNFDGNFNSRAATLFPVQDANIVSAARWNADVNWNDIALLFPIPDVNLLDLSWTKLQNYPTGGTGQQAVQTIGDTLGFIYVPSEANIDANALGIVNSLDLNNSLNYSKVNCDNNANCTFTGKITTGLTIDANNIKFNGTLSGGDFNQSILDHNNSFSCNAGEAIQTIGNTTACIAVGGSGTGRTYTSGTPATIQVNNDTNTISQNFDGNFQTRFDSNFNTRFPISFDSNFYPKFLSVFDSNFYTKFKPMFDSNLAAAVPWQDVNVTNDLTIDTNKAAKFKDINFSGTLSGGDFNYSLNDANGSQTATAGQALSSVGVTVTSIPIPPSLGSCDNNVNCTITGKITTSLDANFNNIKFLGVLSGGDFNYSLSDANGSQNCGANLALNSVGLSTGCISVPSQSMLDNNYVRNIIFNAAWPVADANIANAATYKANCDNNVNCVITGRINSGFDLNALDLNVSDIFPKTNSAFDLGSNALRWRQFFGTDINVFGVGGFNRGNFSDLNATRGTIKDLNVTNDLNVGRNATILQDTNAARDLSVGRDLNVERNTGLDGNLALNVLSSRMKFKTNTVQFCLYGNDFDANGGIVFAACT